MKFLRLAGLTLAAVLAPLMAQESPDKSAKPVLSAEQVKDNVGKQVVVTGRVAEVNFAEKLVRLNFEKPFPRQPFTAVIFSDRTNQFPDLKGLNEQVVEVNGKITEYRGRPQIVITSTNQLRRLK